MSIITARNKAKDKAIVADLTNARTQIQMYIDTKGTVGQIFSNLCPDINNTAFSEYVFGDPVLRQMFTHANTNSTNKTYVYGGLSYTNDLRCYGTGLSWSITATLNQGGGTQAWCIDSAGKSQAYPASSARNTTTLLCN